MREDQYQAAITFVNDIRKNSGLELLTQLPKGVAGGRDCPVARALPGKARVGLLHAWLGEPPKTRIDVPDTVLSFIVAFDNGEYPELVDRA